MVTNRTLSVHPQENSQFREMVECQKPNPAQPPLCGWAGEPACWEGCRCMPGHKTQGQSASCSQLPPGVPIPACVAAESPLSPQGEWSGSSVSAPESCVGTRSSVRPAGAMGPE